MPRIFVGDSVPTSHLGKLTSEALGMAKSNDLVNSVLAKSIPTSHLPIMPGMGEPGASVPTGHLPSTIPTPNSPQPRVIPTTGSGDSK